MFHIVCLRNKDINATLNRNQGQFHTKNGSLKQIILLNIVLYETEKFQNKNIQEKFSFNT